LDDAGAGGVVYVHARRRRDAQLHRVSTLEQRRAEEPQTSTPFGAITVTYRFSLVLATALAVVAVPQAARASCSGDACAAFMLIPLFAEGGALSNQDKVRKIRITGCYLEANGSCAASSNFDLTIDPGTNKQVKPPSALPNAKLDIKTATFLGAALPVTVSVHNSAKAPISINIKDLNDYREDLKGGETKSVPAANLSGFNPNNKSVAWEARLRDLKSVSQSSPNPVCARGTVIFQGPAGRVDVTKCE